MNTREFEALKRNIEERKQEKARLEGELSACMKQLKELGFNSVEEAETELDKLGRRIDKLEKVVDDKVAQLEEDYNL